MFNLSELARGGTICLSKAGLAYGTTVTITIAAPNGAGVDFAIGGVLYHKADTANITMTAGVIQPALYSCLYLVCLSTGGTLSTIKGKQVLTADITSGKELLAWPVPTAGLCAIGAFRIDTAGTATFTMGTTNMNGVSDVTYTFYDFALVPDAPLRA